MGAQLSLKAAMPLAEILATCRKNLSNTGPCSLWRHRNDMFRQGDGQVCFLYDYIRDRLLEGSRTENEMLGFRTFFGTGIDLNGPGTLDEWIYSCSSIRLAERGVRTHELAADSTRHWYCPRAGLGKSIKTACYITEHRPLRHACNLQCSLVAVRSTGLSHDQRTMGEVDL